MKTGGKAVRRKGGKAVGNEGGPAAKVSRGRRAISKAAARKPVPGKRALTALPPYRLTARPSPSEIISLLKSTYPDARCALVHRNAYELLCATILSAQCTDARVNMVTPALFARYPTPFELARAEPADVEEIIRSAGFFRNKTKSLIGMAQAVVADHGGEIPRTMEELRTLPGVGRKTANVVLSNAYDTNEGVTVDTHVTRLSGLLGLSGSTDPVKIEEELMQLYPRKDWGILSHLLIFHGRQICIARRPRCGDCVLARLCPSSLVRPLPGTI
ncbi:MAG: endonuclease III [Gemmatimonadales bacterium]|nr:endonuclease III [Gemmatimonadales bacterium]